MVVVVVVDVVDVVVDVVVVVVEVVVEVEVEVVDVEVEVVDVEVDVDVDGSGSMGNTGHAVRSSAIAAPPHTVIDRRAHARPAIVIAST